MDVLPPWPWKPTVEIFLEQLSRVVTVDVQKFGSNNVDLKSIAEMSHCVFKASPATFSRVDVTVGRRRKDSVRIKIIFPPQTLRPCARVCLFVTNSFVTRFSKKRKQKEKPSFASTKLINQWREIRTGQSDEPHRMKTIRCRPSLRCLNRCEPEKKIEGS